MTCHLEVNFFITRFSTHSCRISVNSSPLFFDGPVLCGQSVLSVILIAEPTALCRFAVPGHTIAHWLSLSSCSSKQNYEACGSHGLSNRERQL